MRLAREPEVGGDRREQERVENQVVEVEEPSRPGEGEDAPVERGRAHMVAQQHRSARPYPTARRLDQRRAPGVCIPPMADMLAGRVAVVTGAGRGIGRGVALGLAAEGARVVVNDYGVALDGSAPSSGPAFDVVEEIRRAGGEAVPNTDSVAAWDGAARLIGAALEAWGRLDALVTCAGILRDRMVFNMSEEEWDAVIAVHLKGTFNCVRHACTHMPD